ncbi:S41 family peptidase [bacterium]|nr:S41 family peptidase [bacterium]
MTLKKVKKSLKWWHSVLFVLILAIGFLSFVNDDDRNFSIAKNLDIYYTLFRELNSYYVDETNPEELVETSIKKMLESLDPYTTYIPESDMADFRFMTTGEYGGIGSLITRSDKYIIIAEPYDGFPAAKVGLKAGDKILEIDGKDMVGKASSEVSSMLKGTANTPLKLKVDRPGKSKPITFELIREKIHINPVPYYGMVDEHTGIILLNNFTQGCSNEVRKALIDLKENYKAKSIILDLRGNPGGLLDDAVKLVSLFVKKGSEIVSTKGKVKQWDKVYKAIINPVDTIIPIAVLINRGSASASEIVAGSIQDLDRGVVLGQRSFGKGLVQTTRSLSYNAKLKVTTAKYYTPSGRCIQAVDYSNRNEDGSVGLVPDSLINEFTTVAGRKVYDGGGVSPDIMIPRKEFGNISFALVGQSMIFDFVTQYLIDKDNVASPDEFVVSDELFNEFKQYVISKEGFEYESETQDLLMKLKTTAKKEGYYTNVKDNFDALEEGLKLDLVKDLDLFRTQISEFIGTEILKRYYYQKGGILFSLKDDKTVEKATEVLSDSLEYMGILNGAIATHAGDKRNK